MEIDNISRVLCCISDMGFYKKECGFGTVSQKVRREKTFFFHIQDKKNKKIINIINKINKINKSSIIIKLTTRKNLHVNWGSATFHFEGGFL